MRRFALLVLFARLLFRPVPIAAQEHEPAAEKHEAGGEGKEESFAERHELELKIANFVILAGLIGYFIGKNAGPFFANRSEGIRKDLDESMRQAKEAKERAADVDRRLASLEADIAALRAESDKEMQSETARMSKHTADEIAKIQAHAEQEIASAGKAARMDLKRYSAELAVNLAEQKIRSRMTPDTQDGLVQGFVQNLK